MLRRREFLTLAGALAAARGEGSGSYAQELPEMLLAYLAKELDALAARWDKERSQISTAAQVAARNRFVREKVRAMLNGPRSTGPVTAKVTGMVEREGYWIENVMYQSLPDLWVTGNLYVPTTGSRPFPGIISPCGHYELSRMYPDYQYAYVDLVKSGFVVLAYDPIGQGERRQYWNSKTNQAEDGLRSVDEHSMAGQLLLLLGENLTEYLVRDGMRGIDYLLTRPEVDPERIGCAGHSGGGTLTMFISCADERVKCAVINEGGTFHRWPVNLGPGARLSPSDAEQNLFPAAAYGIDACDLHAAIAPRPLLALIEEYNPAFNLTADHIRLRYAQLGAPDKFATEEAKARHAWTSKLRLATTDWLCRWFYERPGPTVEPPFEPEKPETLYCTPTGSLREARAGETIFTIIRKQGARLPPKRTPSQQDIRTLLRYRGCEDPLGVRDLGAGKVEFLSEPGVYIPARVIVPAKRATGDPVLYLDEAGSEAGWEVMEEIARRGRLVVGLDVRGIGQTRPRPDGKPAKSPFAHLFDLDTSAAYMAWYMDRSLIGMRVLDVVRGVDYVLGRPDAGRGRVGVIGKGMGAIWAQYAAALDARISGVVCHEGLLSYRTLTQSDRYLHNASIFVPGVLWHFDLPEVAALIAPRPVTRISPVDAMKRPVDAATAASGSDLAEQYLRHLP